MGIEIERKYLVDVKKLSDVKYSSEEKISQGYLSNNPTVRVRLKGNRGFLTIKSTTEGITRQEYEYEIPLSDAEELLKLCGKQVVKKYRRTTEYDGHIWEIDFFCGRHKGLIMAEVELQSAEESVKVPVWIKEEVSGDAQYYNSNLAKSRRRYDGR